MSVCLFAQTYDGPAQLPIATVNSSMADTPAPGSTITVNAGDDLQAALNSVQCGNTIQLQAGATFTGRFRFPARDCDNAHWIIVRSSSPDSALPAEGHRITPCYAGIVSLVGRPNYPCGNSQNVLATLVAGQTGSVVFQNGANHYRLVGLEITRAVGAKGQPTLLFVERGGSASYIVLDRTWRRGDTIQFSLPMGFRLTRYTGLDQIEGHERYALEYGPILMAIEGSDDARLRAQGANAEDLLKQLTPAYGRPLHFEIAGNPDFHYAPYFAIKNDPFTTYPVVDRS